MIKVHKDVVLADAYALDRDLADARVARVVAGGGGADRGVCRNEFPVVCCGFS
jgi:hypothetical protein